MSKEGKVAEDDLSMDARVLMTAWFLNGEKCTVEVGGRYAQSRLTARAQKAIDELVERGFVTAEPFNDTGRMKYTGTGKRWPRLTIKLMEQHGHWSQTEPNPGYRAALEAKESGE
jgi:hypothetical protein